MKLHTMTLVFITASIHVFASAQNTNFEDKTSPHLINQKIFLTLTPEEQKNYINALKGFISDLNSQAEFSSISDQSNSRSLASTQSEPPSSRAEYNEISTDTQTELERINRLIRATALYKKFLEQNPNSPGTRQQILENKDAIEKRLNIVSNKMLASQSTDYNHLKNNAEKLFSEIKIRPANIVKAPNKDKPIDSSTRSQSKNENHKQFIAQVIDRIISSSEEAQQDQKKLVQALADSKEARCVSAGFVIFGSKCSAKLVQKIQYNLNELGESDLTCTNKNEVLCNPLLTGFLKKCGNGDLQNCEPLGICVPFSQTMTQQCLDISNNKTQWDQVLSLWQNPKNNLVVDSYIADLKKLCEKQSHKESDVYKTCKIASQRFNAIVDTLIGDSTKKMINSGSDTSAQKRIHQKVDQLKKSKVNIKQ